MRLLAAERHLALSVGPLDGLPLVLADPALLKRVIDNLVGNALKFTERGAITLSAEREGAEGRVIAVVQPHRYTRLRDLMDEFQSAFNDADIVIAVPVYPAGEAPIEGVSRDSLVEGLRMHGHRHVVALQNQQELAQVVREMARPGDFVVCLGAGNITQWANALPGELSSLYGATR